jgi:CheY-like chemotaxis protein
MPHLLVIDDDDQLRTMLRMTLVQQGHTVAEARDGNEGLAEHARCPADLVLTDLIMPEKDGLETIMTLRKKSPGIRIIAMSGGGRNTASSYLQIAQLMGARRVLAKPFTIAELATAVAQSLAEP